jgi:hypothetical protein
MKKLILCLTILLTAVSFTDTYLEDHLEDVLEAKYGYISDNSRYLELDFDIHEQGNNIYIRVKVDDDSYREKSGFSKNVFNNYVKQIEKTAKSEAKGKNVIVNSYF